ncbi:MAG: (2Fe-2S) ferredoxin domain-containing protein [Treponema sp.]|jgi:NADH:ubiquinone oxidoreductase subunit E|nr:MAG: (2Fe-2S) ferredoxin domain-containing protein [Treponema sp.]HPX46569.1 (2Fe-2S) ferredoxin domain-containing protein [Treponemataceae bacterium]HQL31650.1 (2Fe-2S) ferredoxin domain-containing protein [Treponemataceae bacterium]
MKASGSDKIVITLCMGSSCFSRGNNVNAELIDRFLRENNLDAAVETHGCLCEGKCKAGPNIRINGELVQGVEPGMITDLLKHKLCGVLR